MSMPAPVLVDACPFCRELHLIPRVQGLIWRFIDLRYREDLLYSDGFDAEGYTPEILTCSSCKAVFWRNLALNVLNNRFLIGNKRYYNGCNYPHFELPNIEDYIKAIQMGLFSTLEDEIRLRVRFVWLRNDPARTGVHSEFTASEEFFSEHNNKRLISILEQESHVDVCIKQPINFYYPYFHQDDHVAIFLAELYRYSSRYENAMEQLKKVRLAKPASIHAKKFLIKLNAACRNLERGLLVG